MVVAKRAGGAAKGSMNAVPETTVGHGCAVPNLRGWGKNSRPPTGVRHGAAVPYGEIHVRREM